MSAAHKQTCTPDACYPLFGHALSILVTPNTLGIYKWQSVRKGTLSSVTDFDHVTVFETRCGVKHSGNTETIDATTYRIAGNICGNYIWQII